MDKVKRGVGSRVGGGGGWGGGEWLRENGDNCTGTTINFSGMDTGHTKNDNI